MLKHLLIYRLAVFNLCALAVVAWLWMRGLVVGMFEADQSYMTYVAVALFAVGLVSLFSRAWLVSNASNYSMKRDGPVFLEKAAHLDTIGHLIVTVGLIGTAAGVIGMLASLKLGGLTDPSKVIETARALGDGVGTAFRSTIVSAAVWCVYICNTTMLRTATICAIEDAKR